MKDKQKNPEQLPTDADELRRRAEQQAQTSDPSSMSAQTPEEIQRVLHELRVHQIELEMQNEELLRTQSALEISHQDYIDLYNFAPAGYCTLSEQGLILEANLTASTLLGIARSAIINMPISRFIFKDDQDIYYLHRKQLFESGEPQSFDLRMQKKDGTPFWAFVSATIAQTEDGAFVCRVILSDITDRKQAELSLEESEQKLRLLAENISQVIYLYDPAKNRFQYVSPAYETIWEEPLQAVYDDPLSFARKVHPDDMETFQEGVRKELEEGIFFDLEYRIQPKRGVTRWIHSHNKPVVDEKGRHILTVGLAQDITARKVAREALAQREEQFRLIAENSTEMIWQISTTGKVFFISPSVRDITGFSPEEISGKKYREIVAPPAIKQALRLFKKALSGEDFSIIEIDVLDKNGGRIPIETSVTPIRKEGKVIGVQGIARDITKRNQAQQEREALLARLSEAQQLANLGIWEWDLVTDREFWSDELFHIFGRKPAKHAPHPDDYSAQYHPHDRDKVHDALEQSLSKSFADTEFRLFRHDDKSERTVRMRCRVENGPDDLPARQIGTIMDITEQKMREQELHRLLSDFKKAQAVSHVGSWRWNITNNSLEWSDEMYNIFGINQDEFTGNLADIIARAIHPDDVDAIEKSNRSVIKKGQPIPLEYRIIRPEGEIRTVWAEAGQLVKDDNGKPASLTGVVMDITDRKLAEIQLSQSQQRYSSLIEDTPLLISRWLPDGTLTFVNRAYSEFFGKKPDALIGTNIFEAIPAEEIETVRQYISRVSPQDPVQTGENRVIRHDGQARWMRWTDRAFFDRNGNITHYQSFGTDIHDRRLTQEERDRLLYTLNDAQRIAHVGSWEWDIPNDIYYWSDELFRIYGRDQQEGVPTGQDHVDVVHPDDLETMRAAKKESLITGSYKCEYRLFRYDNGQERIVSAIGEVDFTQDGKPFLQRGTLRDVTDIRTREAALAQSQRALAENERILSTLMGNLPGMAYRCLHDPSWTMLFVSQGCLDLTGYGPEELQNNHRLAYADLIHPDDRDWVKQQVDQSIADGRPFELSYRIQCKDGLEKWVWENGELVSTADNQSQYLEGFITDITNQKLNEAALHASQKHYQSVVEDSPVMIARFQVDGTITFTNQAYSLFFTGMKNGMEGHRIYQYIHSDDAQRTKKYFADFTADHPINRIEDQVIRHDGQTHWIRWTDRALLDEHGIVIGFQTFGEDISEQKEYQIALETSKQQYQSVVEDSPGMILRYLPDGTIVYANANYESFYGDGNCRFIGQNIYDKYSRQETAEIQSELAALTPDAPLRTIETQCVRSDGQSHWIRWTDRALFGSDGKLLGFQAFGEDITEHKEYEIALQASEQRYQSVVEDAPLMIIRSLHDGSINFTNTPYRLFHTGKNEAVPWNNIFEKYPSNEKKQLIAELSQLNPEQPFQVVEALVQRYDGQRRWVRWKDVALFDQHNNLIGYQSFGEDVHESHIAEQKRLAAEQELNALMANLPGIAYRADANGDFKMRFLSQGCLALTGYVPQELLEDAHLSFNNVMHPEDVQDVVYAIRSAVEKGETFELSYRIITKGGEEKWVWERGFAVLDEAGKPDHIEGFITDITERVLAQEKLAESEARFRAFMDNFPANAYIKDEHGKYVFTNRATAEFVGMQNEEIDNKESSDIFPRELAEELNTIDQTVLRDQIIVENEGNYSTLSGHSRYLRDIKFPIQGLHGEKLVGGIGLDLTAQKAAEERILEKARFEQLLSHISADMLEVDINQIDSKIEDALIQVGERLDLDRISVSSVLDQDTMTLTHIWSRKQIKGTKTSYKLEEYPWMFSTLRDGSIKTWSVSEGIPPGLTDAEKKIFVNGGVQSFLGIPIHLHNQRMGGLAFSDINHADRFTQDLIESLRLFAQIIGNAISLRDTQRNVAESEARFRAFMDNFPANAYIKNENLEYIFVNKVTSSAADLQPEDYIGRKTSDIYPPETAHALEVLDQSVLDQQIIIEKEDFFQTNAGKKRYLRDIKFPIQGFHGEKMVGGIGLDLTAQKAAEERILEKARFEQLLAQISTTFLKMEPEHIDDGINNALKEIGHFLDIDRIVVSRVEQGQITQLTHIWSEKELKGVRSSYDIQHYPWLFSTSVDGNVVIWSANDGLPDHLTKTERDFFRISAVQSLVSLPIQSIGATIGSIIFSDYEDTHKFTPELVESLHLFAQIISNAITLRDAQREIIESEARYRSVVEDSPVLINRYMPDGTIIFANQAYCDFMGKDLSEMIGKKFFEFMPGDARQGAQQRLQSLSAENQLVIPESEVFRADGQERWVRWTVRCLLDPHGQIKIVQSFGIDITDQRQAADRIATSERQFHSLFTEMANGFSLFEVVRDKKGEPVNIAFVDANPAFEHITGLQREEITGKTITDVLPDFDRGWLQDYIDIALKDRTLHRKEFNQRLGIHTDIRAFSPREGQCAVLLTDITEQETLNRQVEIERDKAQDYLDTVQSIMIAMDSEGNLTLANLEACKLLGYTEQELLGKNWFDTCLPQENIAEIKDVFQKIVRGEMESVQYYENTVRTRLGKKPIIAWHNAVMKDRDGNFLGVLSAGEDITARKAAEKRFNTLFDISTKLIMESYDQDMLQGIADEVRNRIEAAQAVTIWLYNPDSHQLTIQAVSGFDDLSIIGLTIGASEGVAGQVAMSRQARLVQNALRDHTFTTIGGFTPEMSRIQCLMCAPLVIKDRLLGVICVDNFDTPQALTSKDLNLVESIANQLAGVVENAILFEQLQQSQSELRSLSTRLLEVQEEERRLVALDLHDHFGQILTTFKLSLRPEAFIKHSEAEQRARLADVTAIVDELIEAAEDLSLRLRPAILDDLGVATAFEWHIQRFSRQTHIPIHAEILLEKGKRFAGNIEITLFRVLEECLSNALRHGDPTTIHVNLRTDQEYIHLSVQDDGSGFSIEDLNNDDRSQTGLTGMQERVRLLNGEFSIDSVPQIGTTIEVKIPIIGEGKDLEMENTP